ncbi:MAG: hypothetical protein NUV74_04750 [Candidatus Brocadiaceae bacterium]|nr:hypothetical protein [Candidatus Brocadiaceae bacterium]
MSREAHVQFCEGLAGKLRRPTLLIVMTKTKEELSACALHADRPPFRLSKKSLKENWE